jgi:hypothetical protein
MRPCARKAGQEIAQGVARHADVDRRKENSQGYGGNEVVAKAQRKSA